VIGTAFGVAVARGDYAAFDLRAGLLFAAVGAILGLGTFLVIRVRPT